MSISGFLQIFEEFIDKDLGWHTLYVGIILQFHLNHIFTNESHESCYIFEATTFLPILIFSTSKSVSLFISIQQNILNCLFPQEFLKMQNKITIAMKFNSSSTDLSLVLLKVSRKSNSAKLFPIFAHPQNFHITNMAVSIIQKFVLVVNKLNFHFLTFDDGLSKVCFIPPPLAA